MSALLKLVCEIGPDLAWDEDAIFRACCDDVDTPHYLTREDIRKLITEAKEEIKRYGRITIKRH